jgi:hypothetical protein
MHLNLKQEVVMILYQFNAPDEKEKGVVLFKKGEFLMDIKKR